MPLSLPIRACILLALIPMALAGCSMGPNSSGPLHFPESAGSACGRNTTVGTYWTFGDFLENTSDGRLTIDSVALINPENIINKANIILPLDTSYAVAIGDWPLSEVPPELWERRQDAEGAVVAPGEQVNLLTVVGPSPKSTEGHADAVEILYHDSKGDRFTVTSKTSLGVTEGKNCVEPAK